MAYDEDLADRIRSALGNRAGLTEKKMFGGLAFLLGGAGDITEKKMFGGLAFLAGGNMAVAVSGKGGLMVRVEPGETDALVAKPGAGPFEMRGRPLDGWVRVDDGALRTKRQLETWVGRGVRYARSLPPKG